MGLSAMAIAGYLILLSCFIAYVSVSIFLLKFPQVLHKKKKRHFFCAHISHRGGAAERLENTLEACRHAIEAGTQMLELDVQISKDRKVVVSHDGDLKRCTGQEGNVHEYNYEELPPMKNELKVTFDKFTICQNRSNSQKMPTLEEVFKAFPTIPINLDVNGGGKELMQEVLYLVKKYNREKITLWGSFRYENSEALYKLNPGILLSFSLRRIVLLYVWYYTGLLPFISLKESYLEIVLPDIAPSIDFKTPKMLEMVLIFLGFFIKSSAMFKHLSDRGIPTYLWVVNEEKHFETAFKLGAEGVMTDCPTKLTQWLKEHPQYKV